MDWKTSLDTTFSDIWRGRNFRRLLTLWALSLGALAVYGTTTTSISLPEIPTDDELLLANERQIALNDCEPGRQESESVDQCLPSQVPNDGRIIPIEQFASEGLVIVKVLSPTFKAAVQVIETWGDCFDSTIYATDVNQCVPDSAAMRAVFTQ